MSLRKSSCDSLASAAGAPKFAAIPLGSAGLANAGPEAEKRGEEGAQRPTRAREDKETSARGHRDGRERTKRRAREDKEREGERGKACLRALSPPLPLPPSPSLPLPVSLSLSLTGRPRELCHSRSSPFALRVSPARPHSHHPTRPTGQVAPQPRNGAGGVGCGGAARRRDPAATTTAAAATAAASPTAAAAAAADTDSCTDGEDGDDGGDARGGVAAAVAAVTHDDGATAN